MKMIAVILMASATSALAQTAPETAKPVAEKKTCRWLMPTGSVMSTRVCNTATKWREFDDYNSEGANQFRNTYRMTTTGNQNPAAPGVPGS